MGISRLRQTPSWELVFMHSAYSESHVMQSREYVKHNVTWLTRRRRSNSCVRNTDKVEGGNKHLIVCAKTG